MTSKAYEFLAILFGLEKLDESTPIIIWGAGSRGIALLKCLRDQGVCVAAFGDNDINKYGDIIDGLKCYSKKELLKSECYIVISPKNSKDLYRELKEQFDHVAPAKACDLLFQLTHAMGYENFFPIGHFYSLYPDLSDVEEQSEVIYNKKKNIRGINLNIDLQLKTFEYLSKYYSSSPKWEEKGSKDITGYRYYYNNHSFSLVDAVNLHSMLRHLRPKKLIEVGSGLSSAVTLDTNEFYLNNELDITFIEPYADLLKSIMKNTDKVIIMEKKLQDIPLEFFQTLNEGDVLFIDTTHVSKVASDVNYLFFDIFPTLKTGVYIHLHDIFYPFEYPKVWLRSGMVWNELYLLRAFLQYNEKYKIIYFESMMEAFYLDEITSRLPFKLPINGGSFWFQKV